ncbi:MAG: DoxX family membrane protein, partial [Solirubrobacteraceae bacterium]
MTSSRAAFVSLEDTLHRLLVRHSVALLRIAVGAVFLGFGVLKYFPGVSPAADLVTWTTDLLTFGMVPGRIALVGVATLECFIGVCLLANRWMRLAVWLLAIELIGILTPLVLLTGYLFSGPSDAPTLAGQYVLKDVVLVAAGMVIAAGSFNGARLVRDEPAPRRQRTTRPRGHPSHDRARA